MRSASSRRTFIVAGALAAAPFVLVGCSSSSSGGNAPATTPPTIAATTDSSAAAGGASFDGDFKGVLTMNLCTGKIGSVKATVDGDDATDYLGSVSATELNFKGPGGGIFSTKSGTEITVDGNTFDTDGLVLTDTLITQKSVTVHGDLSCP